MKAAVIFKCCGFQLNLGMNKILLLFFSFLFSAMGSSQNYKLVWAEEFDGPQLDMQTWNFEYGLGKNSEKQFYTSNRKNVRIENGALLIQSHAEDYEDANYTSTRINTLNKKHFKYGKLEIRAKLPEGNGTWPAIWMLGANHHKVGYPACGEIDIMEFVGKVPGEVHSALHFPEEDTEKLNSFSEAYDLTPSLDGYHIYTMIWDCEQISFFVDEVLFQTFNVADAKQKGKRNVFKKPFYLILNLALGGRWAGKIDDSALPAQFYIDYVRYYKD